MLSYHHQTCALGSAPILHTHSGARQLSLEQLGSYTHPLWCARCAPSYALCHQPTYALRCASPVPAVLMRRVLQHTPPAGGCINTCVPCMWGARITALCAKQAHSPPGWRDTPRLPGPRCARCCRRCRRPAACHRCCRPRFRRLRCVPAAITGRAQHLNTCGVRTQI